MSDPLREARGFVYAVLFVIPLWAVIAAIVLL